MNQFILRSRKNEQWRKLFRNLSNLYNSIEVLYKVLKYKGNRHRVYILSPNKMIITYTYMIQQGSSLKALSFSIKLFNNFLYVEKKGNQRGVKQVNTQIKTERMKYESQYIQMTQQQQPIKK
ncbi:unnamed protein product [Paramecium octaurelia]|uniref:Uncharacterized protein n=1 Tax=Paramecium octaurelia TaxID=43137 RepID=A0A8S1TV67_PAROT|nr:unnamed protein product [Paramecium octaurelia]